MRLVDAIAEASGHAAQARRTESECRTKAHQWIDAGNTVDAAACSREAARQSARAEAWERAAKLMTEVTP